MAELTPWHTPGTAREVWRDAPQGTELDDLLDAARLACWRYVPSYTRQLEVPAGWLDEHTIDDPPALVPVRYRLAQLLQARAVYQLPRAGGSGELGLDGYQARLYVFGYDVQRILVPPTFDVRAMVG